MLLYLIFSEMQIIRKHSWQFSQGKVVGICMPVLIVEKKSLDFRAILKEHLAGSWNGIHEYR